MTTKALGVIVHLLRLILFPIGTYLQIKIIRACKKDKDKTWLIDVTRSVVLILLIFFNALFEPLNEYVPNYPEYRKGTNRILPVEPPGGGRQEDLLVDCGSRPYGTPFSSLYLHYLGGGVTPSEHGNVNVLDDVHADLLHRL